LVKCIDDYQQFALERSRFQEGGESNAELFVLGRDRLFEIEGSLQFLAPAKETFTNVGGIQRSTHKMRKDEGVGVLFRVLNRKVSKQRGFSVSRKTGDHHKLMVITFDEAIHLIHYILSTYEGLDLLLGEGLMVGSLKLERVSGQRLRRELAIDSTPQVLESLFTEEAEFANSNSAFS